MDETLNDIVAEIRGEFVRIDLERLADRIEAAAEREREDLVDAHDAIARLESELAEVRRERDTLAAERTLGNAAALRVALENARSKFIHIKKCADKGEVSRKKLTILCEFVSQEITDALAAPARNCDRFATEDEARKAYWAYREPLEFNNKPFVAITEWLFAPAEGGDHA